MICPRCNASLREQRVDAILLDKCDGCGGVWFDFAELERAVAKDQRTLSGILREPKGRTPQPPSPDSPLICPRCNGELLSVRSTDYPEVEIHACLGCYGRWLDGSEMDRIRNKGLLSKFAKLLSQIV